MIANRAWVLLPSGRRLDLLNPDPQAWTDHDLSVGLSRTYRWAGYSAWDLPLSGAQHSLTVLAIRQGSPGPGLTPPEALRELLHDAEEALLGAGIRSPRSSRISDRASTHWCDACRRPSITAASCLPGRRQATLLHKHADRLAAASEAFHVAGWSRQAMRESLGITLEPLADDPLPVPRGMRPWELWPPNLAAHLFLTRMNELQTASSQRGVAKGWCHAPRR